MVCVSCGCRFDESEASTYQDYVGEFWGAPAYMTYMCCPECKSDEVMEDDEYEEEYGEHDEAEEEEDE